jgi:D-3-phosphoglycerate dehydrogenase
MRVLIADKFEQSGLDGLKSAGCDVSFQPGLKDDALAKAVSESQPDVLVVRSTTVTEAILAAGAQTGGARGRGI